MPSKQTPANNLSNHMENDGLATAAASTPVCLIQIFQILVFKESIDEIDAEC